MQHSELPLSDRQNREREYHKEFAERHSHKINEPVALKVIEPGPRRPWNCYWTAYDLLIEDKLAGKRIMVPGCGFGDDAIRFAKLGAEVYAFDLSEELLDIANGRAKQWGVKNIHFAMMPAEHLSYDTDFFDLIYFCDILHHVDIPAATAEAKRVLKPGGKVVTVEMYTHSLLQKVRNSWIVSKFLYGKMLRFIYFGNDPYITQDEHKIDQHELAILESIFVHQSISERYFSLLFGRIVPVSWIPVAKIDRAIFAMLGPLGRMVAGQIVVSGTVQK